MIVPGSLKVPRPGCRCLPAAVVEVLQQDFPGILGTMSDPHSDGSGHESRPAHDHGRRPAYPEPGLLARLRHASRPHSHEAADHVDAAMEASTEGMRALWISLAVLGVTALIQAAVTAASGSVALLGDTLHNAADAFTAIPLGSRSSSAGAPQPAAIRTGTGGRRTLAGIVIASHR